MMGKIVNPRQTIFFWVVETFGMEHANEVVHKEMSLLDELL